MKHTEFQWLCVGGAESGSHVPVQHCYWLLQKDVGLIICQALYIHHTQYWSWSFCIFIRGECALWFPRIENTSTHACVHKVQSESFWIDRISYHRYEVMTLESCQYFLKPKGVIQMKRFWKTLNCPLFCVNGKLPYMIFDTSFQFYSWFAWFGSKHTATSCTKPCISGNSMVKWKYCPSSNSSTKVCISRTHISITKSSIHHHHPAIYTRTLNVHDRCEGGTCLITSCEHFRMCKRSFVGT